MTIKEIRAILEKLNLPKSYISDQTAICILSFLDNTERKGLLPGHNSLNDGARIHDILNFARTVLRKKVAENTREAYRKTSLAPLMNYGIIIRHQLSTNDPNTYYRLHPDFSRLFSEKSSSEIKKLIDQLHFQSSKQKKRPGKKSSSKNEVSVQISGKETFSLSPGEHNYLEKSVVEVFGHAFVREPLVVYLGDTAPRQGYQNRTLMRKLNLPIDTTTSLPDVILYSEVENHLVIVEAVTSSGPVTAIRHKQLKQFTSGPQMIGCKISHVSAFPSRTVFRKFVEDIAWGSSVWIENEPSNIIHFQTME